MQTYQQQATRLTSALNLPQPPIGIAFSNELPENVARFEGDVPAGCSFWQLAANQCFVTTASDHQMCSIGVHTHNLAGATQSQPVELAAAIQAMVGLDYVRAEEVAGIPVMASQSSYVTYGPLADLTVAVDCVLLFAHAQQGLILSEAVTRVDGNIPPAMGRPACAAIPQVVNQGNAAMSLGCCGARAYLDTFSDSMALWSLPIAKLDQYCDQIEALARANSVLTMFHSKRADDVAAGQHPSVAESLERLS
jgi:uncharacterized protein (DUF169 family)